MLDKELDDLFVECLMRFGPEPHGPPEQQERLGFAFVDLLRWENNVNDWLLPEYGMHVQDFINWMNEHRESQHE